MNRTARYLFPGRINNDDDDNHYEGGIGDNGDNHNEDPFPSDFLFR